jgi:hypothetical protein
MRIHRCQQCGITFTREEYHLYKYCSRECYYAHVVTVTNPTITASLVRQIRRRYTGKYGQQVQFAQEYGLKPKKIWQIVHRLTWRHLA